jgi:hypothetical protein
MHEQVGAEESRAFAFVSKRANVLLCICASSIRLSFLFIIIFYFFRYLFQPTAGLCVHVDVRRQSLPPLYIALHQLRVVDKKYEY